MPKPKQKHNRSPPSNFNMKYILITTILLGSQLHAAEPHCYDLAKRASEIDPRGAMRCLQNAHRIVNAFYSAQQ